MDVAELRKKFPEWDIKRVAVPTLSRNTYQYRAERLCGVCIQAESVEALDFYLSGGNHKPEILAEADQWVRDHPNYCRKCGGTGGVVSSFDPSPAGVSLSPGSMYDWDPCPDCYDKGICPECSEQIGDPDEIFDGSPLACPHCGWDEEKHSGIPLCLT